VDKCTAELQRRTTDLEKAIKELRDTQQQVISLLRNRHGLLVFHREKFRPPLTNESGPLRTAAKKEAQCRWLEPHRQILALPDATSTDNAEQH